MPDLTYRQQKIQEKRKQTPFRDFVMEIVSWRPLTFYKNQGFTSKYPLSERVQHLVSHKVFLEGDNIVQGESPTDPDFFVALQTLLQKTPLSPTIISSESENAIYSDQTLISANIYLSSVIVDSKNILYSLGVKIGSENVVSSCAILQSENIYASTSVSESYEVFYSHTIHNSSHIWRCNNLIGCHFCYKCHDLENKSYCINNQQFSKEQYINTIDTLLSLDRYQEEIHQHKSQNINCNEVIGAGCINCNELTDAYICKNISFGRNLFLADDKDVVEHVYDCFGVGGSSFASANHLYGIMGGGSAEHIYCSANVPFSNYTFYSYALENCSFCLWCIGLQNKHYCILNRQYTKEERHSKVDEIFTQMEKDWTLWQFFPARMNPFYFNDTAAYLIDPTFTKEEVEKAGYLRRDEPIKVDIPTDLEQVHVRDLDQYEGYDENGKRHINEEILKKVIIDDQGNVRRIVNMEYVFLMKHALPLPRKHRLERMKENFRIG